LREKRKEKEYGGGGGGMVFGLVITIKRPGGQRERKSDAGYGIK
jgi:hypothetical protein